MSRRKLRRLEEIDFVRSDEGERYRRICDIGDDVDPEWGMNYVTLSCTELQALNDGRCIWMTDGEYSTVIRGPREVKDDD